MKNELYILLLVLCGSIVSCKSPTQTDQIIVNTPPIVTITGNRSTFMLGDTLRLSIHSEDLTLKSGTIDFKDSTVIVLNNLKPVFDSTFIHVYKSIGTYNITASFTDGNQITSKQFTLTVVSNPPPVLTLIPNKTSINVGDTLKIALHTSDTTLSNGYINFNDGTVISFNNLSKVLDTTIIHVYFTTGTFNVKATFSDGYNSTNSYQLITITNRHFGPSLTIGMTWRFEYNRWKRDNMIHCHQWGEHVWRINSFSVLNQDTTYFVSLLKLDTVNVICSDIYMGLIDTTYFAYESVQSTFVSSSNSIQFNFVMCDSVHFIYEASHNLPSLISSNVQVMPRIATSISDSVVITGGLSAAIYENQIGPIKCYGWNGSAMESDEESLTLIEFIKP